MYYVFIEHFVTFLYNYTFLTFATFFNFGHNFIIPPLSVSELLRICKIHIRVSFHSVSSSSGPNFVCLQQCCLREPVVIPPFCVENTQQVSWNCGCGLQVYLALTKLCLQAFDICLKQHPRHLHNVLHLWIRLSATLMNKRIIAALKLAISSHIFVRDRHSSSGYGSN